MQIVFATMKKRCFYRHVQGIIENETKASFKIRTLGIGNLILIKKADIIHYRIESPPPAFTKLIF